MRPINIVIRTQGVKSTFLPLRSHKSPGNGDLLYMALVAIEIKRWFLHAQLQGLIYWFPLDGGPLFSLLFLVCDLCPSSLPPVYLLLLFHQ